MDAFKSKAEFEVRWYPFQLNPQAPEKGESRVQMYMRKFGGSKEQTVRRAESMGANFKAVGLPYKFTDAGISCNTWNGHRLVSYAYHKGGAKMQDAVMEELFLNYFGEEKFMNDPEVLRNAARKGNMEEEDIKKIVDDSDFFAAETQTEMQLGRQLRVSGVPFFLLSREWAEGEYCENEKCSKLKRDCQDHCPRPQAVSGAQDSEVFKIRINSLL